MYNLPVCLHGSPLRPDQEIIVTRQEYEEHRGIISRIEEEYSRSMEQLKCFNQENQARCNDLERQLSNLKESEKQERQAKQAPLERKLPYYQQRLEQYLLSSRRRPSSPLRAQTFESVSSRPEHPKVRTHHDVYIRKPTTYEPLREDGNLITMPGRHESVRMTPGEQLADYRRRMDNHPREVENWHERKLQYEKQSREEQRLRETIEEQSKPVQNPWEQNYAQSREHAEYGSEYDREFKRMRQNWTKNNRRTDDSERDMRQRMVDELRDEIGRISSTIDSKYHEMKRPLWDARKLMDDSDQRKYIESRRVAQLTELHNTLKQERSKREAQKRQKQMQEQQEELTRLRERNKLPFEERFKRIWKELPEKR